MKLVKLFRVNHSLIPRLSGGGGASEEEKESLVQTDHNHIRSFSKNSFMEVNVISCE